MYLVNTDIVSMMHRYILLLTYTERKHLLQKYAVEPQDQMKGVGRVYDHSNRNRLDLCSMHNKFKSCTLIL